MSKKVEKENPCAIDSSINQSRLISILNYISQSITVFDKNGNVLFCNAKAIDLTFKLFGIRLKGGENVFDFLVPAYQHKFRELMQNTLQAFDKYCR